MKWGADFKSDIIIFHGVVGFWLSFERGGKTYHGSFCMPKQTGRAGTHTNAAFPTHGQMLGWADRWMGGWTDEWIDG